MLCFPETNPRVKLYTVDSAHPTNFILELCNLPENRIDITLANAVIAALDHIEGILDNLTEEQKLLGGSLITTSSGKFFSNGLDVEKSLNNPEFHKRFTPFLVRLMNFRLPTIAAINGHAFAGGCLLAFAHDYIVMNSERGFICMNEIDIGFPLPPGSPEVLKNRVSNPIILRKIINEGKRFSAQEGVDSGFIDYAVPKDKVMETAINLGYQVSKKAMNGGVTLGLMKIETNRIMNTTILTSVGTKTGSYFSKL
ncbi:hypothetical protein BB559_004204 [Furculomyces boomerangus]|uniref:Enoyl-CoA hydratase n=2 Tax=Harpellales TaxID=61421 RepID=A0A2T9YG26_9FUNG|nr:hypothetical protein BB559_004204 [Furculomyces boomerangus]PWA00003.1 hypothetical protein BB558_003961 [Smittium angustum]